MDSRLGGPALPARGLGDRLPILDVPIGGRVELTIVSTVISCVLTHWRPGLPGERGRSVLHVEDAECECAHTGQPVIGQAYIAVLPVGRHLPQLAGLGAHGARSLLDMIPEPDPIRGQRVWMIRTASGRGSRITWERVDKRPPPGLPPDVDIWPTLCAFYGAAVLQYHPSRLQEGR